MMRDWSRRKCPVCRYFVNVDRRQLEVHERWIGGGTKPVIDIGWPIRCAGSRMPVDGLAAASLRDPVTP